MRFQTALTTLLDSAFVEVLGCVHTPARIVLIGATMPKTADHADGRSPPLHDGVLAAWITDRRRHVTGWTDEAEKLTGYTAAEAVGLPIRALYTVVDQRNAIPELELVAAIGELRAFQGIRVRRDATRFVAWSRVLPLRNGEGRSGGFIEVMMPGPSLRNGFALLDPQRRLGEVVRAARLQLHALRLAASDSETMPPAPLRDRIVGLVDQLHAALEELNPATDAPAQRETKAP